MRHRDVGVTYAMTGQRRFGTLQELGGYEVVEPRNDNSDFQSLALKIALELSAHSATSVEGSTRSEFN